MDLLLHLLGFVLVCYYFWVFWTDGVDHTDW